MASIQKLSIRGVRAFSPDDEEQVIAFGFPLTIIIGKNGCGKTTIIEALKYAVTGALPPGNKSGQAFVHDPKSMGTSQVKAAVKLRFQNRAGKTMVVTRAMELTQKKTTMQFKQLDGTIKTTDDRGNRVALSHKCSELDRQIPQMLGVSKAILEHVVFCHQEDSSWPLMEGAVLKKRFDDIFDSTRYVKALEAIKDTRKRLQGKVKDLKGELEGLKAHKHAAGNYRQQFERCSEEISQIHDEITAYDGQIKVAKEKSKEYQIILNKNYQLGQKSSSKFNDLKIAETKEEAFRKNINDDLTSDYSLEDLRDMLLAHDREMQHYQRKLEDKIKDMQGIEAIINEGKDRKLQLSGEKGLLLGEKKIYDQNLKQRVTLIEDMATNYGFELPFSQTQNTDIMSTQQSHPESDYVSDMISQGTSNSTVNLTMEDLDYFNRCVDQKNNELQDDLKAYKKKAQNEYDLLQAEISDMRAKMSSHNSEIKRLQDENTKAGRELKSLPTSTGNSVRGCDIEQAKKKTEEYMKEVDRLNKDPERESIPRQIKEKEAQVESMKKEIEKTNSILKDLRKCAEDQNKIKLLHEQVQSDVQRIDEMKTDNDYILKSCNVEVPNPMEKEALDLIRDIVDDFTSRVDNAKSDLDGANETLEESSNSVSRISALLKHKKDNLSKEENELKILNRDDRGFNQIKNVVRNLRAFETTLFGEDSISPSIEPQYLLEHIARKEKEVSAEINPESKGNIIQKLKKMAIVMNEEDKTVIKCPCCTQKLEGGAAAKFTKQLGIFVDALIQSDDDTAKLKRSALKNYQNWRGIVSRCSNDWIDHKRISEEVTALKLAIENDENKMKELETAYTNNQLHTIECKDELAKATEMKDLAQRFKENFESISKKLRSIDDMKEQCELDAPNAKGRDLTATENDLNRYLNQKDILTNEISNLNKRVSDLNKDINDANQKLLRQQKVVESKERMFAQEQEASARRTELRKQITKNKDREDMIKEELKLLSKDVSRKEVTQERKREVTDEETEKKSNIYSEFNRDAEKIETLSNQINSFKSGDKLQRLARIDKDIQSASQEIAKYEDELHKKSPEVKLLQKQVDDRDAHKKNVESNIELLDIIARKEKINDELAYLHEQIAGLDIETAEANNNAMLQKIRKLEVEISRCEGKKETLRSNQREVQRRLKSKEYDDIDERHRVKMIEVGTNDLAVQDLDVYYNALDKALLRYHGLKIQEINKIIKELWSNTYRGEDITNIRLTSDQEKNSRSTRSYNYRVVMTKGTTELDMRGRCSAGQRVLASIVIRLALAETFGLNFGVMALDEPTTNLDYENKRGLAISLARIIAQRSSQDNFQLAIITHDEDFVGFLKSELSVHTVTMPEKYFLVHRQEGNDGCYYSKLKAVDWEDM